MFRFFFSQSPSLKLPEKAWGSLWDCGNQTSFLFISAWCSSPSPLSCICTLPPLWHPPPDICSVAKSCLTLCDPMDCSTLDVSVLHQLPHSAQTHVHWVDDAIQPSHSLLPPSSSAHNLSQHLGLFQWVGSSLKLAKVSDLQLQHQSFQWIFRVYFH